jgi:hypothetical protein
MNAEASDDDGIVAAIYVKVGDYGVCALLDVIAVVDAGG